MKALHTRVDRIFRKTHAPVMREDWRLLADYYLERMQEHNLDPEEHRAASMALGEKLRMIDVIRDKEMYQGVVNDFAINDEPTYLAHLYFSTKLMADSPDRLMWLKRELVEGGFRDKIREVRTELKTIKRPN